MHNDLSCSFCGGPDIVNRPLIPYGIGEGAFWVHHKCWFQWNEQDKHFMQEKQYPPSGRLFRNDYQNSPNAPQLRGDLEIDEAVLRHLFEMHKQGQPLKMELSAWKTPMSRGGFFYRLKSQVPYQNRQAVSSPPPRRSPMDDLRSAQQTFAPNSDPFPDQNFDPLDPQRTGDFDLDDEIPF